MLIKMTLRKHSAAKVFKCSPLHQKWRFPISKGYRTTTGKFFQIFGEEKIKSFTLRLTINESDTVLGEQVNQTINAVSDPLAENQDLNDSELEIKQQVEKRTNKRKAKVISNYAKKFFN